MSTEVAYAPMELRVGSVAGLRVLRRWLGDHLVALSWPPGRIADAQLVLAEIATNAFVHDAAVDVAVSIVTERRTVRITTSHPGDVEPPSAPATLVDQASPGGRGLAIVDQLVSSRSVESHGGVTSTLVVMSC